MGAEERNLRNHLSLTEKVYATLRDMIISSDLPPGTRLKDAEVARQLGVSNTPVREALRRLTADSLVWVSPRHGTFVRRLTVEDFRKLSEIRAALEVLATRLTAERAGDQALAEIAQSAELHLKAVESGTRQKYLTLDRRFHALIAEGSGNEILVSMLDSIADRIQIARFLDRNKEQDFVSGREHQDIAAVLLTRDGEKAAQLMLKHIQENRDRTIVLIERSAEAGRARQESAG